MSDADQLHRLLSYWQQDQANTALIVDILVLFSKSSEFEKGIEFSRNIDLSIVAEPRVAYHIGILCLAAGKYAEAETEFNRMLVHMSEHVPTRYNLAYAQYAQQKISQARNTLDGFEYQWRECPELLILLARCEHFLENIDVALEHIDKYLSFNMSHLEAKGLKSLLLVDKEDYVLAYQLANDVIAQEPLQLEANIAFSAAAISLQKTDYLQEQLQQALSAHPNVGRLWMVQAELDMLNQNFEQAEIHLKKTVKLMPDHIGSWHLLAWSQLLSNQLSCAEDSFNQALTLNRNFADTHGGLAVLQVMTGNYNDANDSIRRALKLDSTSVAGRYAKTLLLEKQGNQQAAQAIIKDIFTDDVARSVLAYFPELKKNLEQKNH